MSLQSTYDQICERLDARPKGASGKQIARCPAHDDRRASLSIDLKDEKILLHCFAGCPHKSILQALQLQPSDLFADASVSSKPRRDRNPSESNKPKQPALKYGETARYTYEQADGTPQFFVVRQEATDEAGQRRKQFRQSGFDADGKPTWRMTGVKRLPYRLPQVFDAIRSERIIVVLEGEKDVHTAEALGYAATTLPGGAKKTGGESLADECLHWFKSADVVLCPDNDETGQAWMQMLAGKLRKIASRIRWLELPGLPPKGDLSDWQAQGGTAEKLEALLDAATEPPKIEAERPQSGPQTTQAPSWILFDGHKSTIHKNDAAVSFFAEHKHLDPREDLAKKELSRWLSKNAPQVSFTPRDVQDILDFAAGVVPEKWEIPSELRAPNSSAPDYPINCLPALVKEAVEELADFVQAPPAMAAQVVFSSLSFAAQALCNVARPTEREELISGCNTAHLTLAESSERKSSCDSRTFVFLREEERRLRSIYAEVYKELSSNHELWAVEYKARTKALDSLLRKPTISESDQQEIEEIKRQLGEIKLNEPPKVPDQEEDFLPTLFSQNFSVQQLARRLKAFPAMTINSAEGAVTFGAFAFSRDQVLNTLGTLNSIVTEGSIRNDRVGDSGVMVEGARLTLNVMIQPSAANELFNNELYRGTGFLARLCVASPRSLVGERSMDPEKALQPKHASTPALNELQYKLRALVQLWRIRPETGEIDFLTLRMSDEAKHVWVEYYNQLEGLMKDGERYEHFRDVAGKNAELAARLAAQIHCIQHVKPQSSLTEVQPEDGEIAFVVDHRSAEELSTASRDSFPQTIDADTMVAGCELARWYLDEFLRVSGVTGESQGVSDAQILLRWLKEHPKAEGFRQKGDHLSLRTIRQSAPYSLRKADRLKAALDVLEHANYVRLNESAKGFKGNPMEFLKN